MAIEKRAFGKTGHMSSAVIFGAAALWDVNEKSAARVLDLLFEYGVNHIDVAPGYGTAELRVGEWMPQHRKDFFLATKSEHMNTASSIINSSKILFQKRRTRIRMLRSPGL